MLPQINPFDTTKYPGELSSDHDTDDDLGSEGLRNLLQVTQPASGRARFEPRTLNHFNAALYRGLFQVTDTRTSDSWMLGWAGQLETRTPKRSGGGGVDALGTAD